MNELRGVVLRTTSFGLLLEGSQIYNLATLELDADLDRVDHTCFDVLMNELNAGNLIHVTP
jgi:hypothetical protein